LHIGSNLPPKDNLQKEDKSSAPKVSFIRRFHCSITKTTLPQPWWQNADHHHWSSSSWLAY